MADVPSGSGSLTRADVLRSLDGLSARLADAADEVRLVGTASSLLRGIDLQVGDVDVLAKQRGTVDDMAQIASKLGRCTSGPAWSENPWFGQYAAEFDIGGVPVTFSTVEVTPAHPIAVGECIRECPWNHFDMIDVDGHSLPVVASELRLQSEISRSRPDRWRPIGRHLAQVGYAATLFDEALESLPVEMQDLMKAAVRSEGMS